MAEEKLDINYVAEPTLVKFHRSPAVVRGIMGPVGSGKSVGCWMEIIIKSSQQRAVKALGYKELVRRTRWAVVRNTYPELKTTTIKTAIDWTPEPMMTMNWGSPVTGKIDYILPDKTRLQAEILFLALDRPQDIKKLLSLEITGGWMNEARELPKEILDGLTMRIGRYPAKRDGGPSWTGVFMDTNPPDDDHWWFHQSEEVKPDTWEFFHQPSALIRTEDGMYLNNPAAENVDNQPLGYKYWHQMLPGKTQDWINVYVMGNYGTVEDGKPVYPEYNDIIHCAEEDLKPYPGIPLRLGWDFGLTPAVALFQITPKGQCRVLDEIVALDMGVKRFIRDEVKPHLSNKYPGMSIISVGDPAGTQRTQTQEDTCMQILKEEGLQTMPAHTQELVARREAVSQFLMSMDSDGKPNFQLSPRCRYLRKGFNGAYKYERVQVSREERYKDKPHKNVYSHIHEGLQYGLLEVTRGYRVKKYKAIKSPPRTALGWT